MIGKPYAWATHAPADYMLVFMEDPDGEHAVVNARYKDKDGVDQAIRGLEGAELTDQEVSVFCTLPGEVDRVLEQLEATAVKASVDRGTITFVASGGGSATSEEAADRRRHVTARVVVPWGGERPRRYAFAGCCTRCGEFHGRINVLPRDDVLTRGGVQIDVRTLRCRCDSIECRYCEDGRVRRPLTEHFDIERRAGYMPWFGYLVPCGSCQAARRGPDIWLSA